MVSAHNTHKRVDKVQTIKKKVLRLYKYIESYKVIRDRQFNQKLSEFQDSGQSSGIWFRP